MPYYTINITMTTEVTHSMTKQSCNYIRNARNAMTAIGFASCCYGISLLNIDLIVFVPYRKAKLQHLTNQ